MSEMRDIWPKPQPGAKEGPYEVNGMDPKTDVWNESDASWPKLPGEHAANFVTARAEYITFRLLEPGNPPGSPLFRMWGGGKAWDIGRWWSRELPKTAADYYGGMAVALHWNDGSYVAQLNDLGATTGVKAWVGPAASQPADGIDEFDHVVQLSKDKWHLEGGTEQVYIPDGSLPFIGEKPTPWSKPPQSGPVGLAYSPVIEQLPQHLVEGLLDKAYARLFAAVFKLSQLLRSLDREIAGLGAPLSSRAGILTNQAAVLAGRWQSLNSGLLKSRFENEDAKSIVKAIVWSFVGTARHLDGDLSWSDQSDAVNAAIREVVLSAYDLARKLD